MNDGQQSPGEKGLQEARQVAQRETGGQGSQASREEGLRVVAPVVLPAPCLVVLVGPSGAGKSTWAAEHFAPDQVVSSDRLRAVVGEGEDDLAASDDAFALLEQVVAHRVARRLTTVVDTLGLDVARRADWLARAREGGVSTACVVFGTPAAECKARNRARGKPVPEKVLAGQVKQLAQQRERLVAEGFDVVLEPTVVRTATGKLATTSDRISEQRERPVGLQFGLHLSEFPGGAAEQRDRLRIVAAAAEQAGFSSIWVMDHFRQIPQIGRAWDAMLEGYTALAYLAAVTERVRLGTLATAITHRNVGHLGKIIATLDVLSGGRAICGLGLGWFEHEQRAYGYEFPSVAERYAILEDALQALPLLWGKGAPEFHGSVVQLPEAMGYPRPLQGHVPILVAGSGEKRTLRLVAQYADMCNFTGEADVVARKLEALHAHCASHDRDPTAIEVTQLSIALVGHDRGELAETLERLRPSRVGAERFAESVNAGTVDDHIGRYRALADAGVQTAIVHLADIDDVSSVARFGPVIEAFSVRH